VEVDHQDDLVDLTLQGSFITAEPFEAGVVRTRSSRSQAASTA
jgi:hypothetical protein